VYNNTFYNCGKGIGGSSSSDTTQQTLAKNNITQGCGDGYSDYFRPGSDYNLSSLSNDAPGSHSKNGVTVQFISTSSRNLHLSSSDTQAKDAGVNLGSDAKLPFNEDIDGQTRSGTWDMGADER
jgi:hypothetical protein